MDPEADNVAATDEAAAAAAATEVKTAEETAAAAEADGDAGTDAEPAAGSEEAEAAKASAAGKALSARKQTFQERINQATRKQHEAERARDAALAEAATARAKLKKPDPSAFEDVTELNAAQFEHSLDVREVNRHTKAADDASKVVADSANQAWRDRVALFAETTPDFKEVAFNSPISDDTAKDLILMEEGPQLAYHLGKHPAEAIALNAMTQLERAKALGKLAGKMEANPVQRRTTKAPAPIDGQVNGKGAGGSLKFAAMSSEEYAAAVAKETAGRRR